MTEKTACSEPGLQITSVLPTCRGALLGIERWPHSWPGRELAAEKWNSGAKDRSKWQEVHRGHRHHRTSLSRTANDYITVVVGCGPVGICTITAVLTMVKTVYPIDSIPERLAKTEKIGAKTIALNDDPVKKIKEVTGRSIVCHPCILEHSHWLYAISR